MHSHPRASDWQGNEADAPTDRLCHLLLCVHGQNDRSLTWFRAGLWTKCKHLISESETITVQHKYYR